MKVAWLTSLDELEAVRAEWDALADHEQVPFLGQSWFGPWWRAFGDGRSLAVAAAFDGGSLAAVFPLARRGRRLEALANDHTPIFRPFGTADGVRHVVDAAIASAQAVVAPALVDAHRSLLILLDRTRDARRIVLVQRYQRQPVIEFEGSWAEYRHSLDRKFRKDIERRRRKLEAEVAPTPMLLERPADVDAELTRAFHAEASGWKGRRGSAILHERGAERFYRELAHEMGDRFRLAALAHDGAHVAFDYTLVDHGRLWILKGGFDETYRRYAPGLVLTLAELERAHQLGCHAVELLGDAVPWKLRFANETRLLSYFGAYRWLPAPLARFVYRRYARPALRNAYRRLPGRAAR